MRATIQVVRFVDESASTLDTIDGTRWGCLEDAIDGTRPRIYGGVYSPASTYIDWLCRQHAVFGMSWTNSARSDIVPCTASQHFAFTRASLQRNCRHKGCWMRLVPVVLFWENNDGRRCRSRSRRNRDYACTGKIGGSGEADADSNGSLPQLRRAVADGPIVLRPRVHLGF